MKKKWVIVLLLVGVVSFVLVSGATATARAAANEFTTLLIAAESAGVNI